MKTLLLGILGVLLFSGCASITLHVTPQEVHAGECTVDATLTPTHQSSHGGALHVKRTLYTAPSGSILVYERGVLDDALTFIVGPVSLMYAGFEFESYQSRSLDRYHDYIEGVSRNNTPVYALVQTLDEGFSLLYSADFSLISPLASCLQQSPLTPFSPPRTPTLISKASAAIQTDWSARMFFTHDVAVSKFLEEW